MTEPATDTADVIIIGTGVIGTATSFELAKQGYKTVCVDRNSQIGHGSTAGSCAIIRMHYSLGTAPPLLSKAIIIGGTGRIISACLLSTLWRVLLNAVAL